MSQPATKTRKAPRLPSTHRISKRPPIRPALPSPYTSARSQKVIYLNAKTPFISALKRARKLLDLAADREKGHDRWPHLRREDRLKIEKRAAAGKKGESGDDDDVMVDDGKGKEKEEATMLGRGEKLVGGKTEGKEEIVFKGMGRAIEKALELGLWFEQRAEWKVRLRTGSVAVVDDIVEIEQGNGAKKVSNEEEKEVDKLEEMDIEEVEKHEGVKSKGQTKKEKGTYIYKKDDIPEARVRHVSVIEVGVSWR